MKTKQELHEFLLKFHAAPYLTMNLEGGEPEFENLNL